jgi:hypothetical protein
MLDMRWAFLSGIPLSLGFPRKYTPFSLFYQIMLEEAGSPAGGHGDMILQQ